MQTSVVETRLAESGILFADRKSKNVQQVQNLLYMHFKISPWKCFEFYFNLPF